MPKSNSKKKGPGFVYFVDDFAKFKSRNRQSWAKNSDFWIKGKMRHLADLYDSVVLMIAEILEQIPKPANHITVADTGCGEGWAIRAMNEAGFVGRYIGFDFNPAFIKALKKRHPDGRHEFILADLELPLPKRFFGQADIVLNFFNLFELPQLEKAFSNVASLIVPGGSLIILHIDPMTQLLAVSDSMHEFKRNLKLFEEYKNKLGYDKDIDVGDRRSGRYYRSLLYSVGDYFQCAKTNGLVLETFKEIVKTGNYVPQIYQLLHFRHPNKA
jgi:SAM-dependent methyltransferase